MNILIYFIALIATVTPLIKCIEFNSISLSNVIYNRVKRGHSGTITKPKKKDEKLAIQGVIEKWNCGFAVNRGEGTIHRYESGNSIARLDLQGTDNAGGIIFDRYAIQIKKSTFSVVHIQRNVEFGVELIRSAFEESRDTLAHVYLTEEGGRINVVKDGNTYYHRVIKRFWDKAWNIVWVWGVTQAISQTATKFNKK